MGGRGAQTDGPKHVQHHFIWYMNNITELMCVHPALDTTTWLHIQFKTDLRSSVPRDRKLREYKGKICTYLPLGRSLPTNRSFSSLSKSNGVGSRRRLNEDKSTNKSFEGRMERPRKFMPQVLKRRCTFWIETTVSFRLIR